MSLTITLVGLGGPPPQVFEVIATLDQMKQDFGVDSFNLTGQSGRQCCSMGRITSPRSCAKRLFLMRQV